MSGYYEDRAILAETIGKLAPFIQIQTNLPAIKCQTLAMDILCNSEESGVVSAVKTAKLFAVGKSTRQKEGMWHD